MINQYFRKTYLQALKWKNNQTSKSHLQQENMSAELINKSE